MSQIWTLDDCAGHLRCSRPTVRKMAKTQGLPFFMIGRLWRFRSADVLAWEAKQIAPPKKAQVA